VVSSIDVAALVQLLEANLHLYPIEDVIETEVNKKLI
jgi:hypothetical protein